MSDVNAEKSSLSESIARADFILKKHNRPNPVLVTFQNSDVSSVNTKNIEVSRVVSDTSDSKIQALTSDGQLFQEVDFGKPKMKQFIAVHNRKTNKMTIIEVDTAILINSALASSKNNSNNNNSTDYFKNISKLNKTFGGKKIVSRLQQKEKLNVNSSLMDDEIKVAVKDIIMESDQTLSNSLIESESIIQLIPPCNRNAQKLSDVYLLSDILSEDELKALKEQITNAGLDQGGGIKDNEYSPFFNFCCKSIAESKDKFLDKLAAILYCEVLIKFLKTSTRQLGSRKANFCTFSNLIHLKLMREFCLNTGSSISRPFSMRDKALCYIIVITLICCEFQINLKLLAVVSSVHLNRLSRLAKAVGAVPSSTDDSMYALKLPLPPLPKSSIKKTKRK